MNNIIEIENLVKEFDGFVAVDHISLRVREGEVFGFLGPNGAGKTTITKILCTILNPTAGLVKVCGRDVTRERNNVRLSRRYCALYSILPLAWLKFVAVMLRGRGIMLGDVLELCFKTLAVISFSPEGKTWISMPECITWIGKRERKGLQRCWTCWI